MFCSCANNVVEATPPAIDAYEVPLRSVSRTSLSFLDTSKSSEDVTVYATEIRELSLADEETPERAAVNALLGTSTVHGRVSGENWKCNSVAIVQSIAFIDISIPEDDDGKMLPIFRTACTITLSQLRSVNYVYLSVDGQLDMQFADASLEAAASGDTTSDTQPTPVYYPDKDGKYLLPVVRNVHIEKGTVARTLFEALKQPAESTNLVNVYPDSVVLEEGPVIQNDKIVSVQLSGPAASREELEMQHACFALSLLQAIPGKEQVNIAYFDGETQVMYSYSFDELLPLRGGFVQLYLTGQQNSVLTRVQQAVPFDQAADIFTCVKETLAGSSGETGGVVSAVPEGISADDFLSHTIYNDLAVISFSENFYNRCKDLDTSEELCLVYSLVNTLTDNGGINKVLFVKDGVNVETLSGRIILSQPLLRNPGIIRQ